MLTAMGAVPVLASVRPAKDLDLGQDFSGTVLIARHDRPLLVRAAGKANGSLPNRPDTKFVLASMTKMITGVAVGQLAQDGRIAFPGKLSTYLDGFPPDVTVHQLLTHTSGVGRPALGSGPPPTWTSIDETVRGTLEIIRTTPPRFTPGTRYEYSNDAFWLLGAIVSQVTGLSYYDYVRRNILTPAGMTRSDFLTRPQVLAAVDVAHPYWTQPDGTVTDFTTSPYFAFIGGPDNGLYSTAEDILRFTVALRGGKLLSRPFTDIVTGGKVPVSATEFAGYGFRDLLVDGQRVFGHPGGGPGQATNLDVGTDWAAVVLSNHDTRLDPIVNQIRQMFT